MRDMRSCPKGQDTELETKEKDMDIRKLGRIKGCLWKEGVNGLGVGPAWLRRLVPYRDRFDTAARVHDDEYDQKGDGHMRFLFDKYLLENMLRRSGNDVQAVFSVVYFVCVRMFGWLFYRYDREISLRTGRQKGQI